MSRLVFRTALALSLLFTAGAQAQLFRAYVASYGADTNPCTLASPCRLLPAALVAVANDGEVWILDSANFNTARVDITKSVSIVGLPGQIASIVAVANESGIRIATSGVRVGLRNVMVANVASSPGTNGVEMYDGAQLMVDNCIFANLPSYGIYVHDTAAQVHVRDSVFRNIGSAAILALSGPTVDVSRSKFLTTYGVIAYGGAAATTTTLNVTESAFSGGAYGMLVYTYTSGATARGFLTRSTVHNTVFPVTSETADVGTATVAISGNSLVGNVSGFRRAGVGATLRTLGNNNFTGNGANTGALSGASLQ
jgi:hypothetical protein